ncbi:unnamed protein product [Diabrotica balteata]|uniref:Reverse transcriptase domain-containing protein n=1 Tax=Diabrotica balteata TaxID=107213 RepID=A0A9N9XEI7_DIABA|nr:unnamed protein product [Diabrotica balteata]
MDTVTFREVVGKFEKYCNPKKNLTVEKHYFLTRVQKDGETIEDFMTSLKNLSLTCELGILKESLVCDMFIIGLNPKYHSIKQKLLQEVDLKTEKVLQIAQNIITTQMQAQQLNKNSEAVVYKVEKNKDGPGPNFSNHSRYRNEVPGPSWRNDSQRYNIDGTNTNSQSQVTSQNFKSRYNGYANHSKNSENNQVVRKVCQRCGENHRNKCPALVAICHYCKKQGHYAKCCQTKRINNINLRESTLQSSNNENDSCFVIKTISQNSINQNWSIVVRINKINVVCYLDTGAQANVMSIKIFNEVNVQKLELVPTCINLKSFLNDVIPIVGKVNLLCEIENRLESIEFIIVNLECQTILGLDTCHKLKLIKRVGLVSHESIIEKNKQVFAGLGCLPNVCHLEIDKNIKPIIEPPRRIPFSLHDKLKEEFNRMLSTGIIEKVNEASEWINSIVLVEKSNKSLRVCLDPRNLNKAIKRCHYPIPTFNEIRSKLAKAKYFSTLDAQSGFWMIPLDLESSKLCTFNTPFGRFRFTRLPYGISCAPEIFHKVMNEIVGDIEGVCLYIDDILNL